MICRWIMNSLVCLFLQRETYENMKYIKRENFRRKGGAYSLVFIILNWNRVDCGYANSL